MLTSQLSPEKPGAQSQVYPPVKSSHTPSFRQGLERHSSISSSQRNPAEMWKICYTVYHLHSFHMFQSGRETVQRRVNICFTYPEYTEIVIEGWHKRVIEFYMQQSNPIVHMNNHLKSLFQLLPWLAGEDMNYQNQIQNDFCLFQPVKPPAQLQVNLLTSSTQTPSFRQGEEIHSFTSASHRDPVTRGKG